MGTKITNLTLKCTMVETTWLKIPVEVRDEIEITRRYDPTLEFPESKEWVELKEQVKEQYRTVYKSLDKKSKLEEKLDK